MLLPTKIKARQHHKENKYKINAIADWISLILNVDYCCCVILLRAKTIKTKEYKTQTQKNQTKILRPSSKYIFIQRALHCFEFSSY